MKKLLYVLWMLLMLGSLAACGSEKNTEAGVMFALKCHWWMRSMRMMLCSMAMIPGEITRKIKEHSL